MRPCKLPMGRSELVLAGGTDAMSHAPLLFNEKMVVWLARWFAAKIGWPAPWFSDAV